MVSLSLSLPFRSQICPLGKFFVTLSDFTKLEVFKQCALLQRVVWWLPAIVNLQVGRHPAGTKPPHSGVPDTAILSHFSPLHCMEELYD